MPSIRHLRSVRLVAVGALATALVATVVAVAGAAPIQKSSYMVAECFVANLAPGEWSPAGPTLHMRNMSNLYAAYVREGTAWREIGTVTTYPNANITPNGLTIWGAFVFSDDGTIGNFTGSFNWSQPTNGMGNDGRGSGVSDDGLVKITLGGIDPTPYMPLPGEGCDVREYLVMSPQG